MNDSPRQDRHGLWRAAPIVLSIVFVLIAGLVIWRSTEGATPTTPPTSPQASAPTPSACGPQPGDQVATTDGTLKVGTIFPQGPADVDSAGKPLLAAAELAADDVTRAGGIPGLPTPQLRLDANLDEGAPGSPTSCDAASSLLKNGDDVMVGPYASADTLSVMGRITQAGRLMVSPSNTLPDLTNEPNQGRYFRTTSPDGVQARALADLVVHDGRSNVAVVAENDPFALSLAGAVTDQLKASGVTTTRTRDADPSAFKEIADGIAAGPYDGVVFVGFRDIADLVGILLDRGVTPQNRGFYGSTGLLQNPSAERASPGALQRLQGFRGYVPWADPGFNGQLKSFYQQRFGSDLKDETYGAQTYDAVIAVSLAAAEAHTDDPVRIAQELPQVTRGGQKCGTYQQCVDLLRQNVDIDYDGVSGPLGFTSRGDVCRGRYNLSAFGPNGLLDESIQEGLYSPDLCRP